MTYKCKKCMKKFKTKQGLAGHANIHSKNKRVRTIHNLICKFCKNPFKAIKKKDYCSPECNVAGIRNTKIGRTLRFNKTLAFLYQYRIDNPLCEICGEEEKILYKGSKRRLAFDHDHDTNEFRGMLCFNCNTRYEWFLKNHDSIEKYFSKTRP